MRCVPLLLILALTSCTYISKQYADNLEFINKIKKSRTISFISKQGMYDGCISAQVARGTSMMKTGLIFRQNPALTSNDEYVFGWRNGYTACFVEATVYQFMPIGERAWPQNTILGTVWFQRISLPFEDPEVQSGQWQYNKNISEGLPGVANDGGTPSNFFGIFGSCYAC